MSALRYALNASTIRPTPLLEKIRVAGQAGYAAIELWHDDLNAHLRQGGSLAEVRQALDDHGLAVPTTIAAFGWLGTTGAAHAEALEETRRRLDQAAQVGARHLIASPCQEPCDLSAAGAQYRELLELGRPFGVAPAMEYLGFVQSVHTVTQAYQVALDAAHPDASVVMDPFHILRGGSPLDSVRLVPPGRVAVWHWNDLPATKPFTEQTDEDRVMPGEGVAPLRPIEAMVRQQGYQGYVSLELFNPALWAQDPLSVARLGLERLRTYFAA